MSDLYDDGNGSESVRSESVAGAVHDIAGQAGRDRERSSVITPLSDKLSWTDRESISGASGSVGPELFTVGTGEGTSLAVFSGGTGVLNVSTIGNALGDIQDQGTPQRPRRVSAIAGTLTGTTGETMTVTVSWAPPLTDTTNRWLQCQYYDSNGQLQVTDSISTYIVSRTNTLTGETVTVGIVGHSEQYTTQLRTYLESANLVTTDTITQQATFDNSLWVSVLDENAAVLYKEVQIPGGHDAYFSFTDRTAIYGQNYSYTIQANSNSQTESDGATIVLGSSIYIGSLDLSIGTGWCSSYPSTDGSGKAFADIASTVGGLITTLDVALIPIQPGVLDILPYTYDTTGPLVLYTSPLQVNFNIPSSGTLTHTLCFRGRNIELAGGISSIIFRDGITAQSLSTGLTKTQVTGTDDWDYVLKVDVASTATAGTCTFTVAAVNGHACACSSVEVISYAVASSNSAVFISPGAILSKEGLSGRVTIDGYNMDYIQSVYITRNDVAISTVTPTNQSHNQATIPYSVSKYGTYKLKAQYAEGILSSEKDYCYLTLTEAKPPESSGSISSAHEHGAGDHK